MPARPRIAPPVGKSGPGMMLHQLVERDVGLVHHRKQAVDRLAEIVRRDVGRHADRDAAGAVDEQVGEARRQDDRLELLLVVVRLEVDRVLVEILEQRHRDLSSLASVYREAAGGSPSTEPKLPCPSMSGARIEKSCAMRTSAS